MTSKKNVDTRRNMIRNLAIGVGAGLVFGGCDSTDCAPEPQTDDGGTASLSNAAAAALAEINSFATDAANLASMNEQLVDMARATTLTPTMGGTPFDGSILVAAEISRSDDLDGDGQPLTWWGASSGGKWSKHNANVMTNNSDVSVMVSHNMNYAPTDSDATAHHVMGVLIIPLILGNSIGAPILLEEDETHRMQTYNFNVETTLSALGASASDLVWGFGTATLCNTDGVKVSGIQYNPLAMAAALALT